MSSHKPGPHRDMKEAAHHGNGLHPGYVRVAYCQCGKAIVELAGRWWHLAK